MVERSRLVKNATLMDLLARADEFSSRWINKPNRQAQQKFVSKLKKERDLESERCNQHEDERATADPPTDSLSFF